jgi:hypothetical protein
MICEVNGAIDGTLELWVWMDYKKKKRENESQKSKRLHPNSVGGWTSNPSG